MISGLLFVWFVLNTLLLGAVSRRLLGVPVGWPRTIVVSAIVLVTGGAPAQEISRNLGLINENDQVVEGNELVVGAVTLVVLLWIIAAGLAILVILEAIVPTGSLPGPLTLVRGLPARRRRAARYAAVVGVAVRHGLGGFLGRGARRGLGDDAPRVARALREAFTDAGVTFVKLGQMLATRPDLVGEPFARELARLQSEVEPEPWTVVKQTLEEELHGPLAGVLPELDPQPIAAASVGQVHTGRLTDGTPVVVKVQRRNARAQVTADLDIVRRLAAVLEKRTNWGRSLGLTALADGFAASLDEELDYRVEAANARAISAAQASRGAVHIPVVHEEVSGPRVLVMERVEGLPVSRAAAQLSRMPDERRSEIAGELLTAVLRQILGSGVFHADLHGGNVVLRPDDSLALLDFGSVGRLDSTARDGLARLLAAIDRGDSISATDALITLLDRPAELDDRLLEREVGALIGRYRHGLGALGASGLFPELFGLVVRHGFAVPPQLAATFRSLGALEGTLRLIEPGLDLVGAARAAGRDLIEERLAPAQVRAGLEEQLAQLLPVLKRLPRRVDALTGAAQDGRLSVQVRLLAHEDDRAFVTDLVQQVTMTVLAAAATVSAVLLILAPDGPELGAGVRLFPLLGATIFLFGFVLAARVLALAFQRRGP
ncbi:MAG TPA: AarF/UbiB family protein [Nocardioides sp.]|nr:AarF/UbiB family protein [Nocardioides sp.]